MMKITKKRSYLLWVGLFAIVCLLSLRCVQRTSANLENDASLQIADFFDKQNKLFEGQKRYEHQKIVELKKLDRKTAEVTIQYRFIDKYMTVNRTEEVRQSTFLFRWQDEGKLIVPPESKATRVHWVLTKTWEYDLNRQEIFDRSGVKNR
jgi:hypothetical protein